MRIMELIAHNIWVFLWVSIVCGIIGSILGTILYKFMKKRYTQKKNVKYLVKIGFFFGSGSRTAYAMEKSSFHQILLVGDYLKGMIISITKIIMCGIVTSLLLIILRNYWISIPIIIAAAGIFSGVELTRLRDYIRVYNEMFKYVYGDDYFKSEMEGIKQYWGTIKEKKRN